MMKWFLYVEPTQEVVTYLLNSLNANNFRSSLHVTRDKYSPLHKQSRGDEEYETLIANDADLIIVLTNLGDFIVSDHQLAFIDVIIQRAWHETYVRASTHQ